MDPTLQRSVIRCGRVDVEQPWSRRAKARKEVLEAETWTSYPVAMREIVTHILLPFDRETIWAVLVDLRGYREWNPLNVWADGEAIDGAVVPMKFIDPGHPGRILSGRVRMTVVDPPSRLEWVGRLLPPLFTGRHFFVLKARGNETELVHGERLSGLLPAMWSKDRMDAQRRAYEGMNAALARTLAALAKRQTG